MEKMNNRFSRHKKIIKGVLQKIEFNENEIKKIAERIKKEIKKYIKDSEVVIGGSLAKGTMINDKNIDIDIFVLFNKEKYEKKDISVVLKRGIEKIKEIKISGRKTKFKFKTIHGSRDYFYSYFKYLNKGIKVEIIPLLKIKKSEESNNIMDMSPLHVKYVCKKLSKKGKKEVKILKAFTKAIECYGAESHIRGFSGYSLELLIIKYKNFLNLCQKAISWKEPVYIDIEKKYKNKKEALEKINKSKISPILLIDPVDKKRNVLAALSEEKFYRFVKSCKKFLKKPSKNFFIKKEIKIEELLNKAKKSRYKVVVLSLLFRAKFDVAGAKALKFYTHLMEEIKENFYLAFNKVKFIEEENKAVIYLLIKKKKEKLIKGPYLKLEKHVKKFKSKHKKTIIKGGRILAIEKPKTFEEILKRILKNKKYYKIKKIEINING